MIGKLVVVWILGGSFLALLILNSMFASGSSAASSGTRYPDARAGRELS
jgi:hypothetical protein